MQHTMRTTGTVTREAALQNTAHVMPVGGGYALLCDGQAIGAIGFSGGSLEQDEKAALAAIAEVGLTTGD